MAFDLSTLTQYTEEPAELIKNAVTASRTVQEVAIQAGIKSSETINIANSTVTFQDGTNCGFSALGDDEITQRKINTSAIKVNKDYCMNDLEAYFTQKLLQAGANYDEADLPAIFFDEYNEELALAIELAIWRGNSSGATGNNTFNDGFIKIFEDDFALFATGNAVGAGTAFNGNEIAVMQEIVTSLPENVRDSSDVVCFMGRDYFDLYQFAIYNADGRYVAPEDGIDGFILFTNIPIIVVPGLTGTEYIFTGRRQDFVVGTDLENDFEQYKFWFSDDDDKHKLKTRFRLGAQFSFPENVVVYNNGNQQ